MQDVALMLPIWTQTKRRCLSLVALTCYFVQKEAESQIVEESCCCVSHFCLLILVLRICQRSAQIRGAIFISNMGFWYWSGYTALIRLNKFHVRYKLKFCSDSDQKSWSATGISELKLWSLSLA